MEDQQRQALAVDHRLGLFTNNVYRCLGDQVTPTAPTALHRTVIQIRRRFQFSSALKRMSTISTMPNGTALVSVKGAPETIKTMLQIVPDDYDETYKYFTRRGSRVLALGWKNIGPLGSEKVWLSPRLRAPSDNQPRLDQTSPSTTSGECADIRRLPRLPLPFEV